MGKEWETADEAERGCSMGTACCKFSGPDDTVCAHIMEQCHGGTHAPTSEPAPAPAPTLTLPHELQCGAVAVNDTDPNCKINFFCGDDVVHRTSSAECNSADVTDNEPTGWTCKEWETADEAERGCSMGTACCKFSGPGDTVCAHIMEQCHGGTHAPPPSPA